MNVDFGKPIHSTHSREVSQNVELESLISWATLQAMWFWGLSKIHVHPTPPLSNNMQTKNKQTKTPGGHSNTFTCCHPQASHCRSNLKHGYLEYEIMTPYHRYFSKRLPFFADLNAPPFTNHTTCKKYYSCIAMYTFLSRFPGTDELHVWRWLIYYTILSQCFAFTERIAR